MPTINQLVRKDVRSVFKSASPALSGVRSGGVFALAVHHDAQEAELGAS